MRAHLNPHLLKHNSSNPRLKLDSHAHCHSHNKKHCNRSRFNCSEWSKKAKCLVKRHATGLGKHKQVCERRLALRNQISQQLDPMYRHLDRAKRHKRRCLLAQMLRHRLVQIRPTTISQRQRSDRGRVEAHRTHHVHLLAVDLARAPRRQSSRRSQRLPEMGDLPVGRARWPAILHPSLVCLCSLPAMACLRPVADCHCRQGRR